MSQFFFTPLSFQAARNHYRDRLQEMDPILFPSGDKSLLDRNMSPEEADKALEDALESRLGQGSVSGNLVFFAKAFSDGELNLGLETSVKDLILSIADNRDLLEQGIKRRSADSALRVMLALLGLGGVGAGFLAGRLGASVNAAKTLKTLTETLNHSKFIGTWSIDPNRLALLPILDSPTIPQKLAIPVVLLTSTSSGDTGNSQVPASDDPTISFLLLAFVVVVILILAICYGAKAKDGAKAKKGKKSPPMIKDGVKCTEKQAEEILTLAVCLADIYRDKRE